MSQLLACAPNPHPQTATAPPSAPPSATPTATATATATPTATPTPTPTPTPTSTATPTPWPLTVAEQSGQAYVYDATVVGSKPCSSAAPLEVRLFFRAAPAPALRATIKNCSTKEQRVLHDAKLQPSTLALLSPRGDRAAPFDTRSNAKFDNTVYSAAFVVYAAGQERVVEEATFVKEDSGYRVHWLPFAFSKLEPGAWKARASFTSATTDAVDGYRPSAMKHVKVPNVWLGTADSDELTIVLP